jgi:hypothetical protein
MLFSGDNAFDFNSGDIRPESRKGRKLSELKHYRSSLHAYSGVESYIRSQLRPSISLPIHYSLIIVSFGNI